MAKNFEPNSVLFSKGKDNKITPAGNKDHEQGRKATDDNSQNHNPIKCYRCGKIGHIKKNCRVKLSKANVTSENKEMEQLEWEQCFTSEVVEGSNDVAAELIPTQAFFNHENGEDEWIIDSGCSHHVTGNDSLLSELRQHNGERVIVTADNSTYLVAKEGIVKIGIGDTRTVKLNDVFHVPGLKRNLVSVSQITNSRKYVLFGPNDVKVLDNVKNIAADVIFTGEKKGSWFVMLVGEAYVKKTSQTDKAAIWLAQLGHLSYQLLQEISSKKLVEGIPALQNVQEDVKFLKEKSEALSIFAEFKNAVEKKFGIEIKCLRSDNGGEFMLEDFFKFCDNNGILRQMTCPNTPQQNRVSKRILAHLVSMSLSWLHDKNLPQELWAEAVQCACQVINHLPPWPGKEKSPYEMLYDVHIPKSNRTKLDPKAKKCIYVGYNSCRKGWRCMDPETKKLITSRDVVFDEVSSYYSPLKNSIEETTLERDQERLQLLPENNVQAPNNDERPIPNTSNQDGEAIDEIEPASYEEDKDCSEWEAAMQEVKALIKNETWELVPKSNNCEPVSWKWVYKLKKADGTIDRYKARLVARGFSENYGLDYEETFSPVAKMVTPEGFVSKKFPHHVFLLKKTLYGLKQAPRAWSGKIAQYLTFCGYEVSSSDSSMFVKLKSEMRVIVLLYVDDMIITGDNEDEISSLRAELSIQIEIKNLGEIDCFLGLEVERTEEGYFISQRRYATSVVEHFSMGKAKAMATPMEPHLKLKKDEGRILKDVKKFRQLVGNLIYLTITRPDTAYSVSVISQFMQNPSNSHLEAAKRIIRDMKGTLENGLMYKKGGQFQLCGFTDANWAGDV
ncbi:Retrovirus-related Pol polyprotein from transposon TNT 1-94 [Quillaja saponaria]|uniref:Retrovirus-related Pol polyprotein from transposon TNT 1-94 n=1 Tax=Quillaja saponaria TaxID=32244 RepID=A0AAD7LVR0_QUISA|nr:Retrovirus-related Pol polyprotein from transposon TNT 1-94 [Quillaja saponaria]